MCAMEIAISCSTNLMQPESELEFLIGIDPVQDGDIIGFLSYNEVFPDDSLR